MKIQYDKKYQYQVAYLFLIYRVKTVLNRIMVDFLGGPKPN